MKHPNASGKTTERTSSMRGLIEATSRNVFMWVVIASVVLVTTVVVLFFLFKQFKFNNQVIKAENTAVKTLRDNITQYDLLKKQVDKLVASDALSSVRNASSSDNLQVVLDALPATSDSTGFAASLQNIIAPSSGVSLESIIIPGTTSVSATANETQQTVASTPQEIAYQVEVVGSYAAIQDFITKLEKTIRPVSIEMLDLSGTDNMLRASLQLKTYYQPEKNISITKKAITYDEKN